MENSTQSAIAARLGTLLFPHVDDEGCVIYTDKLPVEHYIS